MTSTSSLIQLLGDGDVLHARSEEAFMSILAEKIGYSCPGYSLWPLWQQFCCSNTTNMFLSYSGKMTNILLQPMLRQGVSHA
ncbi:MAG: hypothetical protein FWG26_01720 [Betaproteobacteria bacterium]|jgi:hypothetical protein|nr:hypothetical protein [Betaproteobacteria bacterium]